MKKHALAKISVPVFCLAMVIFASAIFLGPNGQDAIAAPKAKAKVVNAKKAKSKAVSNPAHSYLSNSVWRTSDCGQYHGFQTFNFTAPQKVEVGNGRIGDGERLDIVYSNQSGNIIEIKTKVCAPVGCNQTLEEYKILNPNQIQEWRFEGHLPNEAPNIVVANGVATDGSAGRIFNRCRN